MPFQMRNQLKPDMRYSHGHDKITFLLDLATSEWPFSQSKKHFHVILTEWDIFIYQNNSLYTEWITIVMIY